jgi:hypothetical protein
MNLSFAPVGLNASKIPRDGMSATAVPVLLQAYRYAKESLCDPWQFAVELRTLRKEGGTDNDLRWLLSKGYVLQGCETTRQNDTLRSFRQVANFTLDRRSCFLLTDVGASTLENGSGPSQSERIEVTLPARMPKWDAVRRTLMLGRLLVKRFRQPAICQVTILTALEEDGWLSRIDDPLPPCPGLESKRRLHDTINNLNRHQCRPLIRFAGDGTGLGVMWELLPEETAAIV